MWFSLHRIKGSPGMLWDVASGFSLNGIQIRNSYMGEDASVRYQKFLLQQPEIALRVSLKDIASYLGITPQYLSRIRKNIM